MVLRVSIVFCIHKYFDLILLYAVMECMLLKPAQRIMRSLKSLFMKNMLLDVNPAESMATEQ